LSHILSVILSNHIFAVLFYFICTWHTICHISGLLRVLSIWICRSWNCILIWGNLIHYSVTVLMYSVIILLLRHWRLYYMRMWQVYHCDNHDNDYHYLLVCPKWKQVKCDTESFIQWMIFLRFMIHVHETGIAHESSSNCSYLFPYHSHGSSTER